jgi:hypothetical protein
MKYLTILSPGLIFFCQITEAQKFITTNLLRGSNSLKQSFWGHIIVYLTLKKLFSLQIINSHKNLLFF